ncbi:hypothetical protein [Oscillibacter sp.]|uniref:hypothetical protein n=1 Tax=Oscillibacter sp. TaxID=1945593 RepID=UPI0026206C20|nr:hypothetical protein [Oscillibacter sp.]MDD3347311.1 hypothetical protein [Oscillibacter sp.]
MKDFLAMFLLWFVVCYLVAAFGSSNIWALLCLSAVVLSVFSGAFLSQSKKMEELEERIRHLEEPKE